MKALITGGAGYVGSHCNQFFARQNIETVVLDNLSYGSRELVVAGRFVEGDFGDEKLLDDLFQTEGFDAVIHFAAYANIPQSMSDPAIYYDNNVFKMKTLLDAALKYKVKNVVFSSSAATYGEVETVPVFETDPQLPINPYGTSKLIGEMMLSDYRLGYGLNFCAFRYFNVAGAAPDGTLGEIDTVGNHIVPIVLRSALTGKPLVVFGGDYQTPDGTCLRDYVHVVDVAEAHYLAMLHLLKGGESGYFNLGSHEGFTVLEVIKAAEEVIGKEIPYTIGDRRAGDSPKLIASNQKAREVLGWEPKRSEMKTMISDTYNWEKKRVAKPNG
jgi:UDP-glucose 4-epimerase